MEKQVTWLDEYNIGVESIDKEHRRLFRIIAKLFSFGEEEGAERQRAYQEGIKYFKAHAVKHFDDEENYMKSIHYEGFERHKAIHRGFREETLPALEKELEDTDYAQEAIDHFLGVCTGWLIGHTLTEDRAIVGHESPWEGLLPQQELAAMKKLIIGLVKDMFQLEAQIVSDTYGGERFGHGVYYRLAYGTAKEEQRQEIFLVFEEKLLLNTVGKAAGGLNVKKLDTKLVHASRYVARQFVGRVLEHVPGAKGYELKDESLLNYEQFVDLFQREKPQVSLLFNTSGAGYFAYCACAPHLLEKGVGTPIENDNALAEVEKYLSRWERQVEEEEAHPKPKVLVVDDSSTIRQGMKSLLEEDYEVSLATSGAGAIRAISLHTPDLVLLDYEMPVCDGRQTLEMLRAEEEFRDLPVIFLTGRRDRDSMIQVMPLNPAGYLLKYLKPQEIKQKIDHFFTSHTL